MDKEILRIVIIATGLIIVVAMLIWGYLKDKELQYELDFGDTETDEVEDLQPLKPTTPDKVITVSDDDYDNEDEYIAPIGSAANNYYSIDEDDEEEEEYTPAPPRVTTPSIIQFCLVAKAEEGFNGLDLMRGFRIAGLKYGSLKIFERLDNNQLVDFGVACMVEPGTFPSNNLDSFFCRGIVFFMQPDALDDAAAVFDDYVETIRMLAIELDGDIWDHQRKPLSDVTVRAIRQSL